MCGGGKCSVFFFISCSLIHWALPPPQAYTSSDRKWAQRMVTEGGRGKVINFSTENNCMKLINAIIKNMLVCHRTKSGKRRILTSAHRRKAISGIISYRHNAVLPVVSCLLSMGFFHPRSTRKSAFYTSQSRFRFIYAFKMFVFRRRNSSSFSSFAIIHRILCERKHPNK